MKLHPTLPSLEKMIEAHNMTISAAAEVGDLVYVSGLVNVDLETGALPDVGFEEQARGVISVIEKVLADLDLTLDHVFKVNAYLVDPADFKAWNAVFDEGFRAPRPLRTTVIAGLLGGGIELEVIASRDSRLEV